MKESEGMTIDANKVLLEEIHKEIDLIQGCITRMANNSFLIKGWLISIVAVVITLSFGETKVFLLLPTVLLVVISFWYLDAFFLRTEKLYRDLYIWVLDNRKLGNRDFLYDLNPNRFATKENKILKIMFSKTLLCFYGTTLLFVVVMILFFI